MGQEVSPVDAATLGTAAQENMKPLSRRYARRKARKALKLEVSYEVSR
jgi:hypothetical protein